MATITASNQSSGVEDSPLIPGWVTGSAAIFCAIALLAMAFLGPLGTGDIHYRSSTSTIWQLQGQDLADLAFIVPLLLIGGAFQFAGRPGAKYFLILTPITLMYTGLSIGVGQEWGNPAYQGNVEHYFWIYLVLIIGGLILLIGSLPMFTVRDAPKLPPKALRNFALLTGLALTMFTLMWISQIMQVLTAGDLGDGTYSAAPTVFWTIRYMDLGFSVPLGFLALFLLVSKPTRAYSLVLLFFGFFITMAVSINAMVLTSALNGDAGLGSMGVGVVIFPILCALSFAGLWYLVKDKLPERRQEGSAPRSS